MADTLREARFARHETKSGLGGWGGTPRVGSHVVIGAGAKLLGHIEIGDADYAGAHAVVRTPAR